MKNKRIGSVFGEGFKTAYLVAEKLKPGSTVLVPDAFDGRSVLPILSKGMIVTAYEPNSVFIDGGELAGVYIDGLRRRVEVNGYLDRTIIINGNFYDCKLTKKYDLVYVRESLNRECNEKYTIKEKVAKLQKAVKANGSIHLYYYLPLNQDVNSRFPDKHEIITYFKSSEWTIIAATEKTKPILDKGHIGNPQVHYHLVGYLHAKRKVTSKKQHTYSYNLYIGNF